MSPASATYLAERRADVHQAAPWSPFSYVHRKLTRLIADLLAGAPVPAAPRVVDYGCANKPYGALLPAGADHVGADLAGNPNADVLLAPDGSVPLPSGSADIVLSTQVLEHVADPALYLRECARLLRPGGSLVLTTHGIMFRHPDPEDFWRWTGDGLARIVEEAGLEVVETRGALGLMAAAVFLFQWGTCVRLPAWLRHPYVVVCQGLIALADRLSSEESKKHDALVIGVRALKA
jgi:SAM-dependent methyltransferase